VTGFRLHVLNYVVGYEKELDLSDNSWTPARSEAGGSGRG
jgi:hypothetical protein